MHGIPPPAFARGLLPVDVERHEKALIENIL